MLTNPTIAKLMEMNLKVMAEMLENPDASTQDMSFEDRLAMMVEKEWLARKNKRIKKLLKEARFIQNACIEDIDYQHKKAADKKTIQMLSKCIYLEQKLNVIVSGMTGSGKTYLANALGNVACRQGYKVKYIRMPELLIDIKSARIENRYKKFMAQIQRYKLLIIDDIGTQPYSLEESRDILEITESRYNKASMILVGQIPQDKWYDLFPDPTIADAIMDRIIHNSYIISLETDKSMRQVMAEKVKKSIEGTNDS